MRPQPSRPVSILQQITIRNGETAHVILGDQLAVHEGGVLQVRAVRRLGAGPDFPETVVLFAPGQWETATAHEAQPDFVAALEQDNGVAAKPPEEVEG